MYDVGHLRTLAPILQVLDTTRHSNATLHTALHETPMYFYNEGQLFLYRRAVQP